MKLLNILGMIAFAYVSMTLAIAMPFDESQCRAFASDAVSVAIARDNGIPEETLIQILFEYIQDIPPDSYIKEKSHVLQVLQMVEDAYLSPQEPLVFGAQQYDACVKNYFDSEV